MSHYSLDSPALDVARKIDDIFAMGHAGTAQRTSKVQLVIRDMLKAFVERGNYPLWAELDDGRRYELTELFNRMGREQSDETWKAIVSIMQRGYP